MDREAERRGAQSSLHPLARLLVCILFTLTVVSFSRYELSGLLGMSLYLIVTGIWEDISFFKGVYRLRYLFAAVLLLGLANLFYDRRVMFYLGGLAVTGGMYSMVSLWCKGILTVYAAYFLLLTTGIERLCMALLRLGLPEGMATALLLTYRYLIVLFKEAQRMIQAYALRAPRQRGIHVRAWGSFAGLLLLRSMDRAQEVYDSMLLRGYGGAPAYEGKRDGSRVLCSVCYLLFWLCAFFFLRFVPVFHLVGNLLL